MDLLTLVLLALNCSDLRRQRCSLCWEWLHVGWRIFGVRDARESSEVLLVEFSFSVGSSILRRIAGVEFLCSMNLFLKELGGVSCVM